MYAQLMLFCLLQLLSSHMLGDVLQLPEACPQCSGGMLLSGWSEKFSRCLANRDVCAGIPTLISTYREKMGNNDLMLYCCWLHTYSKLLHPHNVLRLRGWCVD